MHALTHSLPGRTLALALAVWIAGLGCRPGSSLAPSSGAPEYQQVGMIPVPGAIVNAAGGNLMIERLDMSIDTILGTHEIRAVYNAKTGEWLWNFQVTYDGATYVDPTGAVHDVSPIADGAAIPGTVYVKADADTIETKGGMAFHFDGNGQLSFVAWKTADYPRLQYTRTPTTLEISQCPSQPACLPFYTIALNPDGNPLSVTDARTGRVADFQYNGLDRLVVARDALAVVKGGRASSTSTAWAGRFSRRSRTPKASGSSMRTRGIAGSGTSRRSARATPPITSVTPRRIPRASTRRFIRTRSAGQRATSWTTSAGCTESSSPIRTR